MKKVLVTGADGFIGKNLCAMLEREKQLKVLVYTRDSTPADLDVSVAAADFIFHLAGVNRPVNDSEFQTVNRDLTETLIALLGKHGKRTPIVFSSSTQAELDNQYGLSKKAAEDLLRAWAKESKAPVYLYRLPGVFGKWCKPNYNSVVATFCNNIAKNQEITVDDPQKALKLVYIDDVITEFMRVMNRQTNDQDDYYYQVTPQFSVMLGELASKLQAMYTNRQKLLVPDFKDAFDRYLYATFTSYLDESQVGYPLEKKSDDRGWLAEFIKSPSFGQIYVSRTNPGYTRGIHWHNTKIEKFLVIEGEAEIKLRQLQSSKVETFRVSGADLRVMEMPAGYVHSIKNIGKTDMFLLIWSQQVFDPERPDTYFQEV